MERGNNNRKRAREGDHETKDSVLTGGKKPDLISYIDMHDKEHSFDNIHADEHSSYKPNDDDDHDRVFDFPWSKEGVIFKAEEEEEEECQLEFEDAFFASSCSNLDQAPFASASSTSTAVEFQGQQSLCESPPNLVNFQDDNKIEDDLSSFQADELEGSDWIWSYTTTTT